MEPNKKLDPERKYKAWLSWLKRAAISPFMFAEFEPNGKFIRGAREVFKETTTFSPDYWRVYYDEGLHVMEALKEDFKHA